jgi:hypothetical protein
MRISFGECVETHLPENIVNTPALRTQPTAGFEP